MRLIDAEALKKAIRKPNDKRYLSEHIVRLVFERIDNAPTVEERPQGEWIPIKTRPLTEEEKEEYPDCDFMYDCKLPEDGEEVLVTTSSGYVALDTFCRDDGCYFECYCDQGDVLAWQPKPKPYKEDEHGC